jgi:hypothetical protein
MKRLALILAAGLMLINLSAEAVELEGRGSVGASAGMMRFIGGDQFGDSPNARFIFQGMFRYNFTENWSGVLESGWGWNSYSSNDPDVSDTLATVIPTTVGAQYRFQLKETNWWPTFGGGIGLYAMGVKDSPSTWASSNQGTERLTWTGPGFYGKGGIEYIFDSGAAINIDFLYHFLFVSDDRFDRWGNNNTSFAQLRVGASYYFQITGGEDDSEDEDEGD